MGISKLYRSFSGADSLVFIMMPGCKPICLGTITTLSYSIYREKSQVSLIGRINVGGFTRGVRLVAGTMIFTVLNQHWVNELVDQLPWLQEYENIKADELPIFDLMIVSANEYGACVNAFIYGVDVAEEGQVVSVEDMFTESTCRFIARDIDVFKEDKTVGTSLKGAGTVRSFTVGQPTDSITNRVQANFFNVGSTRRDAVEVQRKLTEKGYNVRTTGVYDQPTINAIKKYQNDNGITATGYMDFQTLTSLCDLDTYEFICSKRYKVPVFDNPGGDIVRYLQHYELIKETTKEGDYIKIEDGYVRASDLVNTPPYIMEQSDESLIVSKTQNDCINGAVRVTFNDLTATTSFKVSAISKFSNNKKEIMSKMIYGEPGDDITISTADIKEAFYFNPNLLDTPNSVEFIVYPIGYRPIKNIIKII